MKKSKPHFDDAKLSAAVMRLVAAKGWGKMTLNDVAKTAKIPLSEIKARFKGTSDLIAVIAKETDKEAFAPLSKISGTPHDRLFEILMARFDIMQKHRSVFLNMAHEARVNHALSCALARASIASLNRIIDTSRLTQPPRPILASGIGAVYGWAFYIWCKDTSHDMAKTMAAIDKALRWAGKIAQLILKKT
jgi:AcrR family transcriptional regulator